MARKKDPFDELADRAERGMKLTKTIRRILAGEPAEIQGAILADLLAMWLAGHVTPGDDEATAGYRELILTVHLEGVRKLIPVNFKLFVEPQLKKRTH